MVVMLATLAMLTNLAGPVLAIVIAAPSGPEDTCPNARQVTDALQAHVPGALVAPDRPSLESRPDVLRTVLDVPADGTVVRFTLVDAHGDVQLRRALPGMGRGRPVSDCIALAETIATIVERYLVSVPFQARETEPPPRVEPASAAATAQTVVVGEAAEPSRPGDRSGAGARAYAGAAWRATSRGPSLFEAQVGGELDLTRGAQPLAALLRFAVDEGQLVRMMNDAVALRRFSGRLGLSWALPAGPGAFQLAVDGGVDLFLAQTTFVVNGTTTRDSSIQVTPAGELGVGYRVTLLRHMFLRPQASIGFAIFKYDARYVVSGGGDQVVFHTPGTFSTLGVAMGAVFR